jgi:hypothetical protein
MPRPLTSAILLMLLLLASPRAHAVFAAKTPPSSFYNSSKAVVTAKVTKISPDTGTIEAAATTVKGQPVGDTLKIKVVGLPKVLAAVKPNAPVVLFVGVRTASSALHLADTWLYPEAVPGSQGNFVVRSDREDSYRQSYPGTTAALVKLVDDLKASNGKSPMLDSASARMFQGGTKDLGPLSAPAPVDALFTAHLTADKHQYLLARTPHGFQPFDPTPAGLQPLKPDARRPKFPAIPPANIIALTVVKTGDNPALLALKNTGELLLAQAGAESANTKHLWSDNTPAHAAALGNFGEDPDQIYALVVKDDNIYRYPLDGSSPPADFVRLTGEPVSNYHKDNPKWLAGATAHPLDCNGDGRTDVLINTPAGPLLLINRGFGAFFINADLGKTLVDPAGKPLLTPSIRWTCADIDNDGTDDLLLIAPDGKVTAVLNPKVEEKK